MFGIGLPAVAGFAVDGFQVFRLFIFIEIKISLIYEDSHPHHLPCIIFHYIFIGCIIKAIRESFYCCMAEAAITTQGFGIRFHDAIQLLFADILWEYLQVLYFPFDISTAAIPPVTRAASELTVIIFLLLIIEL